MSDLWSDFVVFVNEAASGFTNLNSKDWEILYLYGIDKLQQKFGKSKVHRWLFNNREAPKLFCKLIAEGVTNGS
jgi:hypothetical protein